MSWIPVLPVLITTAALVLVPGVCVALALRFRGFSAVALAPMFSSAVVGVFGVASGLIGLRWSIWVYLAGTAVTCAGAWALTQFIFARKGSHGSTDDDISRRPSSLIVPLIASAVAGAMISRRLMQLIGQPDNFAQNFDNVFHLNAIRYIIENGNASSLTLGGLGDESAGGVYPAVWHTFAALTMQLTGASVALSENSINIVAASVIWPLACVFFARSVFGGSRVVMLTAGVLSASQVAFPYSLLVWGPLFPNTLATSMLPALLAIIVLIVRDGHGGGDQPFRLGWWIAFVLALAGATTSHMSVINALLVFALPFICSVWLRAFRQRLKRAGSYIQPFFFLGSLLAVIAILATWIYVRPPLHTGWAPHTSTGAAIGEAITNSTMGTNVNWLASTLTVAGIFYLFHVRRHLWLIASYAISVWFYVIDASQPQGVLRDFLTGNWYQDTYRLAAFLPVFTTILGAVGAWAVVSWLRQAKEQRLPQGFKHLTNSRLSGVFMLTLGTCGLVYLGYFGPLQGYIQSKMSLYTFDETSPLLTPTELALVEDIDDYVPEGALIANNPWNGSSMAYAFGGREVLTPHMFATSDPDRILISADLPAFGSDVCAALEDENVEYVLDFGTRALSDTGPEYAGVVELADKPGFELVKSTGPEANLYRITGCD